MNINADYEIFSRKKEELDKPDFPSMQTGDIAPVGTGSDKSQCGIFNLTINIHINGRLKQLFYSMPVVRHNQKGNCSVGIDYQSLCTIVETLSQLGYDIQYLPIQSKVSEVLEAFDGKHQTIKPIEK